MLGAIIGDIVGSPYEFTHNNIKTTDFPLFAKRSCFTDDTVMTLAVCAGLMEALPNRGGMWSPEFDARIEQEVIKSMREFAARYLDAGYGSKFSLWLRSPTPHPYGSYGNGSAMRVSGAAWAFDTVHDVELCSAAVSRVTHNHPEGIKGAQATATAIVMSRLGESKENIANFIRERYNYPLDRTLDEIRPNYVHVESCQETVPEAITAFLESDNFEDALRKAVSLGGDSDTLAAITCSIAEAAYGIPDEISQKIYNEYLDDFLRNVLDRWEDWRRN